VSVAITRCKISRPVYENEYCETVFLEGYAVIKTTIQESTDDAWPASNFTIGHDRTPESAGNTNPIDLTGRTE